MLTRGLQVWATCVGSASPQCHIRTQFEALQLHIRVVLCVRSVLNAPWCLTWCAVSRCVLVQRKKNEKEEKLNKDKAQRDKILAALAVSGTLSVTCNEHQVVKDSCWSQIDKQQAQSWAGQRKTLCVKDCTTIKRGALQPSKTWSKLLKLLWFYNQIIVQNMCLSIGQEIWSRRVGTPTVVFWRKWCTPVITELLGNESDEYVCLWHFFSSSKS